VRETDLDDIIGLAYQVVQGVHIEAWDWQTKSGWSLYHELAYIDNLPDVFDEWGLWGLEAKNGLTVEEVLLCSQEELEPEQLDEVERRIAEARGELG
jgi:hypothetical protein